MVNKIQFLFVILVLFCLSWSRCPTNDLAKWWWFTSSYFKVDYFGV